MSTENFKDFNIVLMQNFDFLNTSELILNQYTIKHFLVFVSSLQFYLRIHAHVFYIYNHPV